MGIKDLSKKYELNEIKGDSNLHRNVKMWNCKRCENKK